MDTRIYNLIDSKVNELNEHYGEHAVTVMYESVCKDWDTTKAWIWMTSFTTRIPCFVMNAFIPMFQANNIIYDLVAKNDRVFIEICF